MFKRKLTITIANIFTAAEAATLWGLDPSTVKRACQQKRFTSEECRKSEGTWLVTESGMIRLYDSVKMHDPIVKTV